MLISQFPGIKSSIIETSEILHSTLWGKNKEKGEGVLWALRGKWEFQMKGRAFFLMNRRFVPDVTFVCRDLQLRAVWCVAGWGVVKGGVEHTGRRILRYSSRPRHFPQNTESHLLNQHKHIWTSVQHIPGIHCKTTQNLVYFKSKNNDFIIHWGAFVSWQILTLVVRRLGTPPPNFPLNLFLFLSFFLLFLSFLSSSPPSFLTKTWKSFMKSGWGFSRPEVDIWVELSEEGLQFDVPHLPSRELHQSEAEELSAGNSCGLMFGYNQT